MDDELFESIKFDVPNFSLRMNNLTAAILRPQVALIDERIASYKEKYERIINILSPVDHIHIPAPIACAENVGDSLQFNLIDFDESDVTKLIENAAEKGVIIQVFGRNNNARDFRNWQYSYENMPTCDKTAKLISFACDLRLPMSFTLEDIELIGSIITEVMAEFSASPQAATG